MFKLFTTLLVLCSTSALVSAGPCDSLPMFCTPTQAINCVRSDKFEDSYYKEAIDDIAKAVEPYIFLDILKNPPQPDNFTDYFKPLDLIAELKKVPTENTNFYDFFRKTQEALMATQDGHFSFQFLGNKQFDNKLMNFYLSPPIVLYADTNDQGEPIMKGVPLSGEFDVYDKFANGAETKEIVTANANVPIVSINGQSPFDFVLNFGSKYYNYPKNFNAKYTYASKFFQNEPLLYYMPMDVEDFSNFTVVYENGEKFSSDFYFLNAAAMGSKRRSVDGEDITEFTREIFRNNPLGKPLGYKDVVKAFNSGEEIKERLSEREVAEQVKNVDLDKARARRETRGVVESGNGLKWDFATKDGILKCKIDDKNGVNAYVITTFSPEDSDDFLEVVDSCSKKMNGNDYPIIAITDGNTGGSILFSNILQEILQPDMVARSFVSIKVDETTKAAMKDLIKEGGFTDPETCEDFESFEQLAGGPIVEDYGNGVTHAHTKTFFSGYDIVRSYMYTKKSNITRRKPTEVVVFTDSYSFSAGSFFTKGLKEAGGAIMVGYNGYPGSTAESFDIGQSPTQVMLEEYLMLFSPDECARLKEKGIIYGSMSFGESFRVEDIDNNKSPLIPREFLVDPADERVPYYGAYSDDAYDTFVEMGKAVLEKYKTECNPENPKLHMRDASCDAVINKEHMHGGFTCGADGKWTTTCEGYYCDDGYYFDYHTKECVKDICYSMDSSSSSSSSEGKESHESGSQGSFSSNLVVNTFLLLFVALMML